MAKIEQSQIVCPALRAAYDRAMRKAFDKGVMPSGDINWPQEYGNSVSTKGTL